MTEQETDLDSLNVLVARAMGWQQKNDSYGTAFWTLADGTGHIYTLPDFCGDVMAIGHMIAWMDKNSLTFSLHATDHEPPPAPIEFSANVDTCRRGSAFCSTAGEALVKAIVAYAEAKTK